MKIEIKANKHQPSAVNLGKTLDKDGVHIENVYLDGVLIGTVCVSSEEDRVRAQTTLQKALEEADGNPRRAVELISQLAVLAEKEVHPDEEVEVKGRKYLISYKEYKLYDAKGDVVANCDDLDAAAKKSMNKDVVKALLVSRINK